MKEAWYLKFGDSEVAIVVDEIREIDHFVLKSEYINPHT
jgi:hypothetical protein